MRKKNIKQIEIISYRNNPPLAGYGGLIMSLLLYVITHYVEQERHKNILLGLSVMFLLIGIWVFIWAPMRIVTVRPEIKSLIIKDRSIFGKRLRVVLIHQVSNVEVVEWKEWDPDRWPLKERIFYWVIVRLASGEELEVTDHSLNQEDAEKVKVELAEALALCRV